MFLKIPLLTKKQKFVLCFYFQNIIYIIKLQLYIILILLHVPDIYKKYKSLTTEQNTFFNENITEYLCVMIL